MPRAARVDLAEALDVLERDRQLAEPLVGGIDRLHAGEVQQRVEQRRGVADREHEAVAAGPDRVVGIEAQEVLPERVGDGRHRHRRAGMSGVGGLHGVHRKRADGGDGELVQRGVGFLGRPAGAGHGVGGHVRHDSTSCDEGVASPAVIGRRGSGVLSRRSFVLVGALLVALPIAPVAEGRCGRREREKKPRLSSLRGVPAAVQTGKSFRARGRVTNLPKNRKKSARLVFTLRKSGRVHPAADREGQAHEEEPLAELQRAHLDAGHRARRELHVARVRAQELPLEAAARDRQASARARAPARPRHPARRRRCPPSTACARR